MTLTFTHMTSTFDQLIWTFDHAYDQQTLTIDQVVLMFDQKTFLTWLHATKFWPSDLDFRSYEHDIDLWP